MTTIMIIDTVDNKHWLYKNNAKIIVIPWWFVWLYVEIIHWPERRGLFPKQMDKFQN